MTSAGDREKSARSSRRGVRLAAALRENLRRRKAQARRRGAQESPESPPPAPRDDKSR